MIRWHWDPAKADRNLRSHGVSFELAERALGDMFSASRPDPYPHEERWQTIGRPSHESRVTLFVVHTDPQPVGEGEERVGRIISARVATPHERRAYEEGQF